MEEESSWGGVRRRTRLDEPPITRGLHFEEDDPRESIRKWAVEWGVVCDDRLDVAEEDGKRDSVPEGVMKDCNEVIFVGGYETDVDREAAKRIVGVEIWTVNEIFRGATNAVPLLSPPEVER